LMFQEAIFRVEGMERSSGAGAKCRHCGCPNMDRPPLRGRGARANQALLREVNCGISGPGNRGKPGGGLPQLQSSL
jgi:hypothetical protein